MAASGWIGIIHLHRSTYIHTYKDNRLILTIYTMQCCVTCVHLLWQRHIKTVMLYMQYCSIRNWSEDSDCLVMLPDSQRTFQQTRSFGLAAKPKTVPGHLLIGNVLVDDLPSLGSIRSAGTWQYQWPTLCRWQKSLVFATNRNGGMLRLNALRHDDDDTDHKRMW